MSADPVSHIDSERLLGLARGTAAALEGEARHVAACDDCRTELELVSATMRLGRDQVPILAADRIAAQVRRRLSAEPSPGPAGRVWWLSGLAAAALAVFAVRAVMTRAPHPTDLGVPSVVVSVLHELDDLDEPQLEAVLRSLPPAAGELDHVEMAPLGDLTANDLEQMLRSMEE